MLFEAQEHYKEAAVSFTRAIELNPEFGAAYYELGQSELRAGETQAGIRAFIELSQLEPSNEKALLATADAYVSLGLFEDALTIYLRALHADPQSPRIHYDLGYLYLQQNHHVEALAQLKEAIALEPSNIKAQRLLAAAYSAAGNASEVEKSLRQAIAQEGSSADLHIDLANALLAQRRREEAEQQFRLAITLEPRSIPAHVGLAKLYRKSGQVKDALQEIDKAVSEDWHDPAALLEKGQCEYAAGDLAKASHDFEEFVRDHPEYPEGEFLLGLLSLTSSKYASAVDHLRSAIRIDAKFEEAYYYLAEALYRSQRTAEAQKVLLHCLQTDPTNPRVVALSAALSRADTRRQ